MKESRLKEFMEQQLENKDRQLDKLVGRQREVGHSRVTAVDIGQRRILVLS